MNRQFETPGPIELVVELGGGTLVTDAVDTDRTEVEVTGPRAEEFEIRQDGNRISVLAPRSRTGFLGGSNHHEVHVVLPAESNLTTRTGSAGVVARGSYQVAKLKTGSGDLEVETSQKALVIESGSGDVRCHANEGEARVKSGSGDVDFGESRGQTAISTGSGDVVVGVVEARLVVKTGSGDLQVTRAAADIAMNTASGDLSIGQANSGTFQAKTASGDVRVGIPAGTPVWTDLSSVSGRVASNLESVGAPAEGQDHVELRASTVSGDITLQQI